MRLLILLFALSACAVPPPSAYFTGAGRGRPDQAVALGRNTVGEACIQAAGSAATADIYCGVWQQPSAHVRNAGPAIEASLPALATGGSWRAALDANYLCQAPRPTSFGGGSALQLDCTRRVGGWPHVALITTSAGQAWLADGVVSAIPAIQHSVAVLSGRETATVVSSAAVDALQAERQGAQARATGDVREFDSLMLRGARANLADNSGAAESAYSAAMALQEKALGHDNPNVADPAMHLALQLSNQGRIAEADALFTRADTLAVRQQGDPTLLPRLLHYEALHAYNQGHKAESLALLRRADAGYVAALPPDALKTRATKRLGLEAGLETVLATPLEQQTRVALLGLVEVRRYQAVTLRELDRPAESDMAIRSAIEVARGGGLDRPELTARLRRAFALNASVAGDRSTALTEFTGSADAFARAYPDSRPLALVDLLRARELVQAGRATEAVPICREGVKVLLAIRSAFEPERMEGCLEAFAAGAGSADGETRQALLRDMFEAAQLVRGSTTSQQIQQASARLAEGNGNARVSDAIREQQDAAIRLAELRRMRETLAQSERDGAPILANRKALDEQERAAAAALASRESALQAAAPNYGQLIQQATSAADVLATLRPDEAFASVTLTRSAGWTFLLRDGTVQVGRIANGAGAVDPLVARIRHDMRPDATTFDAAAAQDLYKAVFGGVGTGMDGVRALTVAPTGSLLSLPFGVLLTGPADPESLGQAPWLVRRMAIGHVPSAGNFVALRRVSGSSKATRPWFGFGDFRAVTLEQARRSFPPSCGDSAALFAGLPPLPSARQELEQARQKLGGEPGDSLLGAAFTAAAVERGNFADYRVLHFATHAILPSDLKCQAEPALVTSAPANAPDASGALLTASNLAQIKLDADVVILSACNSGGPDASGGGGGGESLSTLARSFFYGGARALLITHWDVNDAAATLVIADTLRLLRKHPELGTAGALRGAQLDVLNNAGKGGLSPRFAHPFYWAPFALIGQADLRGSGGSGGSRGAAPAASRT